MGNHFYQLVLYGLLANHIFKKHTGEGSIYTICNNPGRLFFSIGTLQKK
jgi:hypothetical protein